MIRTIVNIQTSQSISQNLTRFLWVVKESTSMAATLPMFLVSGSMKMPAVGLGTWQASDEEIEKAINSAVEAGYRHFDTAFVYMNEKAIGKSLEKLLSSGKLRREDLFIVTKLPAIANRAEFVESYIKESLDSLRLDYVDLYLVHNPVGLQHDRNNLFARNDKGELLLDMETDHISLWKSMENQVRAGRAKAIGLSNFNEKQISRILQHCEIPPANIQVEMHLYCQQKKLLAFCKENNITLCAYAPLGSPALVPFTKSVGMPSEKIPTISPLCDPTVAEIADRKGKLPSQVLLRFLLQLGVAVIPKSSNPERIKNNIEVFDFELTDDEMALLTELDQGEKGRLFKHGIFEGSEKHPEYPFDE